MFLPILLRSMLRAATSCRPRRRWRSTAENGRPSRKKSAMATLLDDDEDRRAQQEGHQGDEQEGGDERGGGRQPAEPEGGGRRRHGDGPARPWARPGAGQPGEAHRHDGEAAGMTSWLQASRRPKATCPWLSDSERPAGPRPTPAGPWRPRWRRGRRRGRASRQGPSGMAPTVERARWRPEAAASSEPRKPTHRVRCCAITAAPRSPHPGAAPARTPRAARSGRGGRR